MARRELQGKPFSKPWRHAGAEARQAEATACGLPGLRLPVAGLRRAHDGGRRRRPSRNGRPVSGDAARHKGAYQLHHISARTAGLLDGQKNDLAKIAGERCLLVPAFRGDRIGPKLKLFKIPEDHGLRIYWVERTGKPNEEFKALVEQHGLTGLRFNLVWTDGKGPAGKRAKRAAAEKKPDAPTTSDRPLTDEERRDIRVSVRRGYKHLKQTPKSSPGDAAGVATGDRRRRLGQKKAGQGRGDGPGRQPRLPVGADRLRRTGLAMVRLRLGDGRESMSS